MIHHYKTGKTPWKDFIAFTQGMRQRMWFGWLWTRLLSLGHPDISSRGQYWFRSRKYGNNIALVMNILVWYCNEYTCLLNLLISIFLSFISVSEQFVEKITLQTVPKTSVLDLIPTKLLYKTLEVPLLTIPNILNKSLTSGLWIQNSSRKTLVKETITWTKWTWKLQTHF